MQVRLTIVTPESIENYNAAEIRTSIAVAAGVNESSVTITITAASVNIEATILATSQVWERGGERGVGEPHVT